MKRVTSIALATLMILSLSASLVGCALTNSSNEGISTEIVEDLMDVSKDGAKEFSREVDSANHEDVEELKKEGEELLNSLDEVDKFLAEDGSDFSEESKEKMTNDVNEMRTIINDAMARLETK